jgi:hypothetical protein
VIDPEQLGHGTTTGLFFARVTLVRDLLALAKIEASEWDTWRMARAPDRALDDDTFSLFDRLAQPAVVSARELALLLRAPPWQ